MKISGSHIGMLGSWLKRNWIQLGVVVLLVIVTGRLSAIQETLEDIEDEVAEVADGIEVEIKDNVDGGLPGLPSLPNL